MKKLSGWQKVGLFAGIGCFSFLALLVVGFASGEHLPAHPSTRATLALVYLAVFGSIIAFSAYLYVLKHARPALATSYAYVNPPVAVLLGILLAGEHLGPFDLAGMAVILLGVMVITLGQARARGIAVAPRDA